MNASVPGADRLNSCCSGVDPPRLFVAFPPFSRRNASSARWSSRWYSSRNRCTSRPASAALLPARPLEARGQPCLGDGLATDEDALVEVDEMGRDVAVDLLAARLQHRRQHRQRTALAVGAGNMHHRRQAKLRPVQCRQQPLHPAQREIDALGVELVQPG